MPFASPGAILTTNSTYEGETLTVTVDDGNGNTSDQTQQVIVDDVTPPIIITTGTTIELWPPNHKYSIILINTIVNFPFFGPPL